MGITVIRDPFTLLRAYNDAYAFKLTTPVKVRHRSIVVSKANRYYPSVLCLKRGILALATFALCTEGFGYVSDKRIYTI